MAGDLPERTRLSDKLAVANPEVPVITVTG
jgi:hypothetical protein